MQLSPVVASRVATSPWLRHHSLTELPRAALIHYCTIGLSLRPSTTGRLTEGAVALLAGHGVARGHRCSTRNLWSWGR